MNNEDRRAMTECVAEGVRRALVGLKLVEEVEHPITKKTLPTKTLAKFEEKMKSIASKSRAASALVLAVCALFFGSCASTTHVTTFKAPSLAPVEQAVTRTEQSVQGAQSAAKKLKAATDEASQKEKAWQDAYVELTSELDNAYLEIQATKSELKVKQQDIDDLTHAANYITEKLANERDEQKAKADAEYGKKMFWMKNFFYAVGALVLAAAWIFKKPLIMFAAGAGI